MKRTTWIVLAVFALLVLALVLMDTNDVTLFAQTPSPTAQLKVLDKWSVDDLVKIEYQSDNLDGVTIQKNSDNSWSFYSSTDLVDQGKAQELLSTIQGMVVLTELDPGIDLEAIGMLTPRHVVVLTNSIKENMEIWIGSSTPTGSGYYVKVNDGAPIIISKYMIDSFIDLMTKSTLTLQTVTP